MADRGNHGRDPNTSNSDGGLTWEPYSPAARYRWGGQGSRNPEGIS